MNPIEIVENLKKQGISISNFVVNNLLKTNNLRKRKLNKNRTIKNVPGRDAQFRKIFSLISKYLKKGMPILSIDSKKKEALGPLFRAGQVYCTESLDCPDHDFSNLSKANVIPHGIFDLQRNIGYINLNTSKDTSEFFLDSLKLWWFNYGKIYYEHAKSILLLCDGGGSNGYRHYVFKEALQKLANEIEIKIRVAHYPSYCSKWNPIEHRMFPHVTRALSGVLLDSLDTMKILIEERAKTKTGLKVITNIITKTYVTGQKASEEFLQNMKIRFDKELGHWNYQAFPLKV